MHKQFYLKRVLLNFLFIANKVKKVIHKSVENSVDNSVNKSSNYPHTKNPSHKNREKAQVMKTFSTLFPHFLSLKNYPQSGYPPLFKIVDNSFYSLIIKQ